jgi:hypothetical protein
VALNFASAPRDSSVTGRLLLSTLPGRRDWDGRHGPDEGVVLAAE